MSFTATLYILTYARNRNLSLSLSLYRGKRRIRELYRAKNSLTPVPFHLRKRARRAISKRDRKVARAYTYIRVCTSPACIYSIYSFMELFALEVASMWTGNCVCLWHGVSSIGIQIRLINLNSRAAGTEEGRKFERNVEPVERVCKSCILRARLTRSLIRGGVNFWQILRLIRLRSYQV